MPAILSRMRWFQRQLEYYLRFIDEFVQLCQFVRGEMSFYLLLINHAGRETLFCHLAVVDLFFHGAFGQEAVNINRLLLAKPRGIIESI